MRITKRAVAGIAALGTAAMSAALLAGAEGAAASTPKTVPVVTVHLSSKHVRLSTGSTLHAGKVIYRVVTGQGTHELQIARLHKGYTLAQAGQDLNKAFRGDVKAVRRIDAHITFRGGTRTRPDHPGRFVTTLSAGKFVFLDQDSNAFTFVTVQGSSPKRAAIAHQSSITAFSYGFGTSSTTIPATGWTRVTNQSDQPHFVEFNRVKAGTTQRQVHRFFSTGAPGHPSWMLRANTGTGVISPKHGETFHYSLPAGEYVIACFWPDDDTGMPHAFMGMWKIIWLK